MSRQTTLRRAARWALQDDAKPLAERPPAAKADVLAVLDDGALSDALGKVAALGRLSDAEVRAMRERRRRVLGTGVAGMLVAVAGFGAWQADMLPSERATATRQHFETRRGEQRLVQLADGSQLHLDGATRIDVTYDSKTRQVALVQGEAYFDVAHDATRPFVVQAGSARTQVLGTAFSIDLSRRAVKLAVYRGRVRFGGGDSGTADVLVPAGWRSSFARGAAVPPTRFDPTQQDWRNAWVDTDDMILGELVEALNRRGGPTIALGSASLANLPLSGRFKLDDPEELLSALGDVYGFRVVRGRDRLDLVPTGINDL